MVNITKYVLIVCYAMNLASSHQEYRDEKGNNKDCAKYEEAWRVAKCASSLKEMDLISNKLFSFYLQVALRKVPSSTAYTSIGFTTGVERELVVGKQSHADFDQWLYTLTYDPRAMWKKRAILSMQKDYMKPVLFFSKTVPDSVPYWDDLLIPSLRLAGNGLDFFLYKSKTAAPFTEGVAENCAAFYEWESRESFEDALGNVIIMDPSLWCPAMDSARFDVVVGDLEEISATNLAGVQSDARTRTVLIQGNLKTVNKLNNNQNSNKKLESKKKIEIINNDKDDDTLDLIVETGPEYEWEKGMTQEQKDQAERNAYRLELERKRTMKRLSEEKKIKSRFTSRTRFWFDERSYIVLRDLCLIQLHKVMGEKAYLMLVGGYVGAVMGVAFIAGRICGLLVPVFYASVVYMDESNSCVIKCLLAIWVITKVVKAACKKKEDSYHHAMMNVYHKPTDWLAIGNGIGFYVEIGIMLGLTYLVYGEGYGQTFHGVWVLTNIMIMARRIPGVGGNSNLGLITLLCLCLMCLALLPEVYAVLLRTTVRTLEPKKMAQEGIGMAAPLGHLVGSFSRPMDYIFGLSTTSFLDVTRAACGNFLTGWLIFDDWFGAGHALTTATMIKMRGKEVAVPGTAGLYGGLGAFWIAGDIFLSALSGAVLRVIVTVVSVALSFWLWNFAGSQVWSGRGKGVMLTEARANFGFVFGNGPIGLRIAVLRCCLFIATTCYALKSDGNVATGLILMMTILMGCERAMTIMLGCITLHLSLFIQGISNSTPITGSLRESTVDAYSHFEGNGSSNTEPG